MKIVTYDSEQHGVRLPRKIFGVFMITVMLSFAACVTIAEPLEPAKAKADPDGNGAKISPGSPEARPPQTVLPSNMEGEAVLSRQQNGAKTLNLAPFDPDGKTLWYDCRDLPVEGKGWTNTESFYDRFPAKARGMVEKKTWDLSRDSAGICVRFVTDADSIQVRWTLLYSQLALPHMPATGVSGMDLYARDKTEQWQFLSIGNPYPTSMVNTVKMTSRPGVEHLLYLPLYNGVTSVEIGIPKERMIKPVAVSGKSIVFYGTSITQGGCASRPGMAYTAIVGRKLDVPVINLGFSGSGDMEPAIGDLLAELDPAIFVLDCMANMKADLIPQRVEPFVKKLRNAHPATPIVLVEDSHVRNTTPTTKGRILRDVYKKLTDGGMTNLYFISNEGMLGDDSEGTVDGCHPNDLGMMRLAQVFIKKLAPLLHSSPQN